MVVGFDLGFVPGGGGGGGSGRSPRNESGSKHCAVRAVNLRVVTWCLSMGS